MIPLLWTHCKRECGQTICYIITVNLCLHLLSVYIGLCGRLIILVCRTLTTRLLSSSCGGLKGLSGPKVILADGRAGIRTDGQPNGRTYEQTNKGFKGVTLDSLLYWKTYSSVENNEDISLSINKNDNIEFELFSIACTNGKYFPVFPS